MKEEFSYVPWSSYYKWFNTGNGHPSLKENPKIESESKSRRVLTHIRVNYTHLSQALVAQMSHCDMDMTRK
jgi:hypothetical protein